MADRPLAVSCCDLRIRYPFERTDAVGPATLEIADGERVLLAGASGSGKSTLLQALTGLVPQAVSADVSGDVRLFGRSVAAATPADWSVCAAQLFQNPEQTLCGMTVADELAFALENQGLPEADIRRRAAMAAADVGFGPEWLPRRTSRLSGGERQLVALAAVVAQQAPLLLIDEPTAHLAPAAADKLRHLLLRDRRQTAIVIDHRLDEFAPMVDRILFIDEGGRVVDGGAPSSFFRRHRVDLDRLGIAAPLLARLDAELLAKGIELSPELMTLTAFIEAMSKLPPERRVLARTAVQATLAVAFAPTVRLGGEIVALRHADCAPFLGPTVLRDVSLSIRAGETVALVGRNGAGKSTLGATLAGLLRLRGGTRDGSMGALCFQNPEGQFLAASVRDELAGAMRLAATDAGVTAALARWRLEGLEARHPYALSQGQKRRLAIACVTASRRQPLIVLDEPSAGLDGAGLASLRADIAHLAQDGHGVVVITHDIDFALSACGRAILLGSGGVVADGPAAQVLSAPRLLESEELAVPAALQLSAWGRAAC